MSTRDESRLFDVRTLDRNLRKGVVSKKEYDKHLKGLPDAADKATTCNPEAQTREAPERVVRRPVATVIATPPAASDDALDDEDLDDEDDLDEDDEDEDEEEDEAADKGAEK